LIALAVLAVVVSGAAFVAGPAGVVVGLALSGTAWTAGLLLFGVTGPWTDWALLVLGGLSWGSRWRALRSPESVSTPFQPSRVTRWLAPICATAASVVLALFIEHSIRYPDGGWDASAIWNLRARWLYGAPHRLDAVFSPLLPQQHPDYPLMLPGLVAHFWSALGSRTQLVPIAVSLAFAAGGLAALGRAIASRRGTVAALCAMLVLLGTPDFLTLAWNQYADLKLAMLLLVAVVLATEGRFVSAGLVAGLAAFTKNEGLPEALALLAAILIRAGPRPGIRFLAGALAPLALLADFKLRWAPPNDLLARTSLAEAARRAPGRLVLVGRGFLAQLVDFPRWGCALSAVAVVWVARWPRREHGHLAPLFVALALPMFFAVYLITPWDPGVHLEASLDRLLFHLWPTILFASAVALLPAEPPAR
jgi:hypothetical protein